MTGRKTVLISGASTGIGAAVARLAAKAGWDVAIGYRSGKAEAETVRADCEALGARAVTLAADLATDGGAAQLFEGFDDAFPRLDAFVNNAGRVAVAQRLDEFAPARLHEMFNTNLIGPFLAAGEAVRRMSSRYGKSGGVIVNISSAAARLGGANAYIDYAASKGAVDVLTKGLSDEVAAEGIRVVGIRPGLIETPIHGKMGDAGRVQRLVSSVPMQRSGSAEEVAEAVLWLMSPQSSYVTGTTLDVSGGR